MSADRVNAKIREAIFAGIFYPEDKSKLLRDVNRVLDEEAVPATNALAIISPHAGFEYSVAAQGAAWKSVSSRQLERVIILASRRSDRQASVYLPESTVFKTPLGNIKVDAGFCAELESCGTIFDTDDIPHLEAHAIELQLPFMKRLFPEALLVPIIVGGNDGAVVSSLARALDLVMQSSIESTLVVVSSNLASATTAAAAAALSDRIVSILEAGDAKRFMENPEAAAISGAAVLSTLLAMKSFAGSNFRLLKRIDSQRVRDDSSGRVVHYAAAAFYPGGGS